MTRRTRRMWRRTAAYTALAIALAADACMLAALGIHDRSAAELAAAVALAYLSVIVLCGAASWSWAAGRATGRQRSPRLGRCVLTAEQIAEHRARAQAEEDAHAAAMAAVADDVPLPERAPADAVEAVRPLPATVPMPTVDPATVRLGPVPYAVRWEFDATGPRTVVGEHAAMAAP